MFCLCHSFSAHGVCVFANSNLDDTLTIPETRNYQTRREFQPNKRAGTFFLNVVNLHSLPSICEHQTSFVPVVRETCIFSYFVWCSLLSAQVSCFSSSLSDMSCTNWFDVIFFPFMTVFTDEDYSQISACCTFKGPGLKDIEYILLDRFNKKVMKEFNSTRGNWTGFTKYSIEVAKSWNADPYDALRRAFEKKILCTDRKDYLQDVGKTFFFLRLLSVNCINEF